MLTILPFGLLTAQEPPPDPERIPPKVERLSATAFRIGTIEIDQAKRTIAFPTRVNMREEAVEYFCVHETGRVHESVLNTAIAPYHLHVAVLLLGGRGLIEPPGDVTASAIPEGTPVSIELIWEGEGDETRRASASSWVLHMVRRKPLADDTWRYTSSRMRDERFLAQRDGTVAAIMADPNALINISDEDRKNDEIWVPNTGRIPPVGTEVKFVITLPEAPAARADDAGENQREE